MLRRLNLAAFVLFALFTTVHFEPATAHAQKKVAVCSTTQIADFTRQIVGGDWEVLGILQPGQDPHTYETRIDDSTMVARADLCLQNGWHLEGGDWMQKLADGSSKPIVSCINGIQPLLIEQSGAEVNDPHAWFSPENAVIYVRNILDAVSKVDPANAQRFRQRAELYLGQLNALDLWIKNQVVQIPAEHRVLITHHDAFGYFCKAYGFKSDSPAGWTTEEIGGIGLERRQEVVKMIREIGVRSIFVETSLDQRMINDIAREAGVEIGGYLYSDAMGPAGSAGETYIGMMRENVLTIVSALK